MRWGIAHAYGECADGECVAFASLRAIEAAEAWLADPSEANREAWHEAWERALGLHWLPRPASGDFANDYHAETIQAATEATSEQAVRDAIRDALVPWALGEL